MSYVPQRGDIVWLQFDPQSGHEQSGRRPALVISPRDYNQKTGLAIFCPITSAVKGYPFEVILPADVPAKGVVLCDQVKRLDWRARRAAQICVTPLTVIAEATAKLQALLNPV